MTLPTKATIATELSDLVRAEMITASTTDQPLPWYLTKPHAITAVLFLILANVIGAGVVITAWTAWAMPLGAAALSFGGAVGVLILAEIIGARPGRARHALAAMDAEGKAPLDDFQTARLAFVQNCRMVGEVLFKLAAWGTVALLTCLV